MSSRYENPLCKRYASDEMQSIFSDDNKFSTWCKLWVALAEAERELGLPISAEQIEEMKAHVYDINYELAHKRESEVRHDVMAHVYTYGEQCPLAKPIIHLGATSCYVGDNTNIILMESALKLVKKLLINTIAKLYDFAESHKSLPCLSYTHFQAAQPTTVGKRAALWMQDLLLDLEQLDFTINNLKLLGCKGTTGTMASFLSLFDKDHEKVKLLEQIIAEKMGFDRVYKVSGQTYSRKVDFYILSVLSGIAQSSNNNRLLYTFDIMLFIISLVSGIFIYLFIKSLSELIYKDINNIILSIVAHIITSIVVVVFMGIFGVILPQKRSIKKADKNIYKVNNII